MPETEINVSNPGTLWILIIGVMVFITVFVSLHSMIPGDLYFPFKDYEDSFVASDVKASKYIGFNQTDSFNMTYHAVYNFLDKTFGGVKLRFYQAGRDNPFYGYRRTFWVETWEFELLGIPLTFSALTEESGDKFLTYEDLARNFDSSTNEVDPITFKNERITLTLGFSKVSGSSSANVLEAWENEEDITVTVNYELNLNAMGVNIFSVMFNIFTFQTVKTGDLYLDVLLNAIVSVPTITAIFYVMYRLVLGVIPFVSGGGGQ